MRNRSSYDITVFFFFFYERRVTRAADSRTSFDIFRNAAKQRRARSSDRFSLVRAIRAHGFLTRFPDTHRNFAVAVANALKSFRVSSLSPASFPARLVREFRHFTQLLQLSRRARARARVAQGRRRACSSRQPRHRIRSIRETDSL